MTNSLDQTVDEELEALKKRTVDQCTKDVMNILSKYELEHLWNDSLVSTAIIEAWQAGAKAGMEIYR